MSEDEVLAIKLGLLTVSVFLLYCWGSAVVEVSLKLEGFTAIRIWYMEPRLLQSRIFLRHEPAVGQTY